MWLFFYYLVDENTAYHRVLEEKDNKGSLIANYTYGHDLISQNRKDSVSLYYLRRLNSGLPECLVADILERDIVILLLRRSLNIYNDLLSDKDGLGSTRALINLKGEVTRKLDSLRSLSKFNLPN